VCLFRNVWMFVCLCMCLQSGLYGVTTPFLFLGQTLSKDLIRFSTLGGLSSIWFRAIPFRSGRVGVTTDFSVNWSQCQRPWRQPVFEGAVLEALSLLWRMPLESRPRWGHHLFQFIRTQWVPRVAFALFVFHVSHTEGESFLQLKVELYSCVGHVEEDHLVLPQASTMCQIKFCI